MALGILVVGSVSILSLFTLGVGHQMRRRAVAREVQVRPEVDAILQTAVDNAKPDAPLANLKGVPLSVAGYALDVDWAWYDDTLTVRTPVAQSYLVQDGVRIRYLGAQPVFRTVMSRKKQGK